MNSDRILIGLCGPIGAGKSTIAHELLGFFRGDPMVVPFANPLKKMLVALGVPYENLYGTQAQKNEPLDILGGKSARQAAQTLGTDWGREMVSGDLWINAWKHGVKGSSAVIVDDVRFGNEADLIREMGGQVYRLTGRRSEGDEYEHASDQQVIVSDHEIDNSRRAWQSADDIHDRHTLWLRNRNAAIAG